MYIELKRQLGMSTFIAIIYIHISSINIKYILGTSFIYKYRSLWYVCYRGSN